MSTPGSGASGLISFSTSAASLLTRAVCTLRLVRDEGRPGGFLVKGSAGWGRQLSFFWRLRFCWQGSASFPAPASFQGMRVRQMKAVRFDQLTQSIVVDLALGVLPQTTPRPRPLPRTVDLAKWGEPEYRQPRVAEATPDDA